MAQLTVYIDEETRRGIEEAARNAGMSVSRWVKERLSRELRGQWPERYFEVLGSLEDDDLERPAQPDPADDAPREAH